MELLLEGVPCEVACLAQWQVVVDGGLEMGADGDTGTDIEAEGGVLEGELLGIAILVNPMHDVVAEVEAELWTGTEEDADELEDRGSEACVGW